MVAQLEQLFLLPEPDLVGRPLSCKGIDVLPNVGNIEILFLLITFPQVVYGYGRGNDCDHGHEDANGYANGYTANYVHESDYGHDLHDFH